MKDLIWLLYQIVILTSGLSLNEPEKFALRLLRMIKLDLSIFNDDNMSALNDYASVGDNGNKMQEVD